MASERATECRISEIGRAGSFCATIRMSTIVEVGRLC